MIRFNVGNHEYDVEPFNKTLGPTLESYKLYSLNI
jgi:hypothetical protein